MKKFINIFLFYNLAVVCLLIIAGFSGKDLIKDVFFVLLFIPMGLYFILTLIRKTPILKHKVSKKRHTVVNISLGIYSFVFINILLIALLRNVSNIIEVIFIVLLLPLEAYFILLALENRPKFKKKIKDQEIVVETVGSIGTVEVAEAET